MEHLFSQAEIEDQASIDRMRDALPHAVLNAIENAFHATGTAQLYDRDPVQMLQAITGELASRARRIDALERVVRRANDLFRRALK